MKTQLLFLLILFTFGFGVSNVSATTYNWTGSGATSNWEDAGNWGGAGYPGFLGTADVAIIGKNATINYNGIANAITTLTISNGFTVNINMTTLPNPTLTVSGNMNVGTSATAVLNFTGTGTVTGTADAVNIYGGTLTTVSTVPFTAANITFNKPNCTATFNGTLTCSGNLSIPASTPNITGNILTTNASGNKIGGVQIHSGGAMTWNGGTSSGTTVNGASEVYANNTNGGALLTIGANNTINFTSAMSVDGSNGYYGVLNTTGNLTYTGVGLSTQYPSASGAFATIVNNNGGTMAFTGSSSLNLSNDIELSNSGTITFASASTMTTSNPSYIINGTTGIITLNGANINLAGGVPVTIQNSGQINLNSGAKLSTGNNNGILITNNVNASINLSGASTFSAAGGSGIDNFGLISAIGGSAITTTSNTFYFTNEVGGQIKLNASTLYLVAGDYINNSGSISEVSGSSMTFNNGSYINNLTAACTFTCTSSTIDIEAGGYITNIGTVTVNSTGTNSIIKLNGNPSTLTNNYNGAFSITSATITSVAGSAIVNTGGQFSINSSTLTSAGNSTKITNNNNSSPSSVGQFTLDNSALTSNGVLNIDNFGTFTAYDGTTINFSSSGNNNIITNESTGTFYAGKTLGSSCTITLGASSDNITNNNIFFLGSTSVIYPSSTSCSVKNSSGTFTLQSDTYGSATIGAVPNGANPNPSLIGTFNVERYIPPGTIASGNRNYRLFSSPVNQSGYTSFHYLSYNDPSVTTGNLPMYTGTPLTNATSLGFTAKTGNPTIYLYDQTGTASFNSTTYNGGTFKGLASLTTTSTISYFNSDNYSTTSTVTGNGIPPGNGVMAYYIGNNASVASTNSNPTTSTPTAVGTINQGQIPVKLWKNNSATLLGTGSGYQLVGNPYPSSIDWSKEQSTTSTTGIYLQNMATVIYEFDYRTKNYGTYDPAAVPTATGNGSNIITSGQGFYVVPKTTGTPTLTFNESAKATAQPTVLLFNSAAPTVAKQLLSIKLAKDTLNTDNIFVLFEPASKNGFERFYDDERLNGIGNIATLGSYASDSTELLAINRMHSIDSTTKVKLYVNVANSTGVDTLSATGFDVLDQRYDVYLIDHFKKDSLLFSKYPKYLFNINNSDTTTFGANRFEIVFHKKAALAYRLISFTGAVVPGGIKLSWTTQNEQNLTGFNLQRLDGSKVFIGLDSLQSNGSGSYSYLDRSPLAGTNVYRLLQDDAFNDISFSNVISITINPSGSAVEPLSIYPNPVTTMLNVKINSATLPDKVILTITDLVGRKIITRETSASNIQQPVSNLLTGDYIIQIADDANNIIGTKKFIKQ